SAPSPDRHEAVASDARIAQVASVVIRLEPPPMPEEPLVSRGETVAGWLRVRVDGNEVGFQVGRRALRRGLLLGRYDRCTGHALLKREQFSRVHALVIE